MGESVSIVSGFGHHAHAMADALRADGRLVRLIESYPSFRYTDAASGPNVAPSWQRLLHDRARWLAAGLQHRVGVRLPWSVDLDAYGAVYAALASRAARECTTSIAFSGFALPTLERFARVGRRAILEEPASHLANFLEVQHAEHRAAGVELDAQAIRFSPHRVALVEAEYRAAQQIHVLSSYAARTLTQRGVDARKIKVVAPGVDVHRFVPGVRGEPSNALSILVVGRVELAKGLRTLTRALSLLEAPWVLHVAGTASPNAHRFMPSAGVVHHGVVAGEALVKLYQSADVVVFPSLSDGFGLVILEAMACGVPVIASTSSGGPDAISNEVDGFLMSPGDAENLARHLTALTDPTRRTTMGNRARVRAETTFSLEAYGARLTAAL